MKKIFNKFSSRVMKSRTLLISIAAVFILSIISFVVTQAMERYSFWSTLESTYNPTVLANPQVYANDFDTTPFRLDTSETGFDIMSKYASGEVSFPEKGYTVKLANISNPNLLDERGNATFPTDKYYLVTYQYEVTRTNGQIKALSKQASVLLPAKAPADNSSNLAAQGITYVNQRNGIFMHIVSGDNGGFSNSGLVTADGQSVPGIAKYCNEFNVDKVVDDIVNLGFNIIFITDFHGLGITLHPSAAIDYWRGVNQKTGKSLYASERDMLGEFISKLKARGVYTVIFTHPLDGHDFSSSQQKLLGWGCGDSEADKGNIARTEEQTQIINGLKSNNFKKWNNFINDVYADIMARYGKDILGIGFDSAWGAQPQEQIDGVKKLDINRLLTTIKSYNKDINLISLGYTDPTPQHIKEVWRPSWFEPWSSRKQNDFNVENWPSYNRAPAVVMTQHWTTTVPQNQQHMNLTGAQMFRYAAMQYGAATTGPAILWSTTPYTNGMWQSGVYEQMKVYRNIMTPIKEAFDNTVPSTSYPINTNLSNASGPVLQSLPNGISATTSTDGKYEYIHVLNPPSSNTLVLPVPKDGKKFVSAEVLKSGKSAALMQNIAGVMISLPSGTSWDSLDTVIKLTVTQ